MKNFIGFSLLIILVLFGGITICTMAYVTGDHSQTVTASDKTYKVARLIESQINGGEYHGCKCTAKKDHVVCELNFQPGSDRNRIIQVVEKVAQTYHEIGPCCHVFFFGTIENKAVCEFVYWNPVEPIERKF